MALLLTAGAQNHALGTRRLFGDAHTTSPQYVATKGAEGVASALSSGAGRPLSLLSADIFSRGREDAVAGYMTAKGGAIVIQSTRSLRGAHDSFSPFEPSANVINVPVTPDFIAIGDVNQDGLRDIIFGARGDSRIYVLAQGSKGTFGKPVPIGLPGALTALASDGIGSDMRKHFVFAGVSLQNSGAVVVLRGSAAGLTVFSEAITVAPPKNFALGNLDGSSGNDLAFTAGGRVFVYHGDELLNSKSAHAESVPTNGTAVQVAIATFVPHRGARSQLAVLNSSGEVSILARGTLDFRPYTTEEIRALRATMRMQKSRFRHEEPGLALGTARDGNWTPVTTVSTAAGANAKLIVSRTSGLAGNDLSISSSDQSRIVTISHSQSKNAAVPQSLVTETALSAPSLVVAPMRIGAQGRSSFVVLSQSAAQPMLVLPAGTTTITVDTFNDTDDANPGDNNCDDGTGKCSLRAAIEEANARNLNDTIVLPDGTYTLSLGELDINAGMTIQSQSGNPANVIIDAGGNGRVMAINFLGTSAFDTTISGVTITDGVTSGGPGIADGAGLTWEASGTGTLSLSNVIVTNNVSTDGGGGGLLLINTPDGTGHATISDSTITANLADDIGGGVMVANNTRTFFNNVTMDSNLADNTGGGGGSAQGGCYYFFGPSSAQGLSEIHGGQITFCNSIADGAGVFTEAGLVMDAGAGTTLLIDSNSAGGNGGGIFQTTSVASEVSSFANVTITNNTAGGVGSGIYENSTAGSVTMTFGRFTQNQSSGGSTGLAFFNAASGASIDVTRNWWACNTTPNTAPCNAIDDSAAAVSSSPWIVLSHVGAPNPIQFGPSADVTLTADFLKDSGGGAVAPGSIPSLLGIPIDFNNAVNGTISNGQTAIQPAGNATATLTVTAGPTAKADAIVDGLAVTASIAVQTANLSIAKSHTGNFIQGQTGAQYTITVSNSAAAGTAPTSGTVTVVDTLPASLTATAMTGTGWSCTLGTLTCTRSDALAPGSSYPAITLTVTVAGNAPVSVTNTADVSGGGDPALKTANDVTTVSTSAADIAVTKTHAGSFFRGQTGATYTLTVKNVGTGVSSGTVTLTDTLPSDLTATAITGTGWTCTLGTLTCTRSDALNGGASYPVVTLTVNVSGTAAATVTNTANVSGGGDTNAANNTASDPTTVIAAFTFTTTAPTLTVTPGQNAGYPFNLTFPTGASGTVTFACSNVPAGSACTFNPPQVTMTSAGSATMNLTISTRVTGATHMAGSLGRSGFVTVFALFPAFGFVLLGTSRRKWLVRLGLLTLVVVLGFSFTGCGNTAPGTVTPVGTYNIGVTATSSNNQQVTTTVTLNIVKQ